MNITMYHNPGCSKSRKTLELLKEHHVEPRIVEYLRAAPDQATILRLAGLLGMRVEELVRAPEGRAGGMPQARDDETLAAWLAANPAALQRPIVVDEDRPAAVVGRPPENVLGLLTARA